MSNSIWKTPDQKPEEYETILFVSYEWGEPELGHYQGGLFVPHDEFESLESGDIEKWCYLDKLIAQADKAELLQKAVDLALDGLEYADKALTGGTVGWETQAQKVIKEIRHLIKGE